MTALCPGRRVALAINPATWLVPQAKCAGAEAKHNRGAATIFTAFCSSDLRTPSVFPRHLSAVTQPCKCGGQNWAVINPRYSTADERSRARKDADGRDSGSRSQVGTTHTGAQWTARPTLLSTPQRLSR